MMNLFNWLKKADPGLFPCPGCGETAGESINSFCTECLARLPLISADRPRCPGCGGELNGALAVCSQCLAEKSRPWHSAIAVMEYRGYGKELIRRFKFGNFPELARAFGVLAAKEIRRAEMPPEIIVPVPLHLFRFWKRSYNQSRLIAEIIGHELHLPVIEALTRSRSRVKQSTLNRRKRHTGLKGIFQFDPAAQIQGKRVLLVDDVLTTGATLTAAAEALLKGEPAEIGISVIARAVLHNRTLS